MGNDIDKRKLTQAEFDSQKNNLWFDGLRLGIYDYWAALVQEFSACRLTKREDRFPAISGAGETGCCYCGG